VGSQKEPRKRRGGIIEGIPRKSQARGEIPPSFILMLLLKASQGKGGLLTKQNKKRQSGLAEKERGEGKSKKEFEPGQLPPSLTGRRKDLKKRGKEDHSAEEVLDRQVHSKHGVTKLIGKSRGLGSGGLERKL